MLGRSIQRWKVWMIMTVMTTSLLLSSCNSDPKDYQTDLGDPSLYKELYVKAEKENKSLTNRLNDKTEENTKLKVSIATLKQQKGGNTTSLEVDKASDVREQNISIQANQNERDRVKVNNDKDELFNQSIEIGIIKGKLEKDEEIIPELKKEITSLNNRINNSNILNWLLGLVIFGLTAYILFQKSGILTARIDERNYPITDVTNISAGEKSIDAGVLEQSRFSDPKALPPENTKEQSV
jgi:hypothetical protein